MASASFVRGSEDEEEEGEDENEVEEGGRRGHISIAIAGAVGYATLVGTRRDKER